MIRFRKRITLSRLAAVPPIVGVTFAVCSDSWYIAAINATLFVLPVFVSGPTLPQWVLFYVVAGVVVGMMFPVLSY